MIVGVEMAVRDRDSFDTWWPQHLHGVLDCVDRLYLRVDGATFDAVLDVAMTDWRVALAIHDGTIAIDRQHEMYGRWQEDAEREALRDWAVGQDADWVVCFDADEVLEPGGGHALRQLLESDPAWRVFGVVLSYCSHHRPGYTLPRGGFKPWRGFRLDQLARDYRWKADSDGLHCGSVPHPDVGSVLLDELRVIHYHATTCAEYMAERAFYDNTSHVAAWGGTDWLYRCDRFGDERQAVHLEDELADADARLARVAAGAGIAIARA